MKSIYSIAILLFCLIRVSVQAQSPNWVWAKTAANVVGSNISTDKKGNSYVTGYLQGDTIFIFGPDTLTNNISGYNNFFVAKYDPSGNVIWARCSGSTGYGYSENISTDAYDNVYITGFYEGPDISFGTDTFLGDFGTNYFFIVKYDSTGNEKWAKSSEGHGSGICIDERGNSYVVGNWGWDSISNTHILFAKFDQFGNMVWSKREPTDYHEGIGNNITRDVDGNIYITGYLSCYDSITHISSDTFFISKYDSNQNLIWTQTARGKGFDQGNSIVTDKYDNVYLLGLFDSTFIILSTDTLINNTGAHNFFLIKYGPSGNLIWAKNPQCYGNSNYGNGGNNLIIDANNNIFMSGSFGSNLMILDTDTLSNLGKENFYIIKYDSSGDVIWTKKYGGTGNDQSCSISMDGNNNIYITGIFIDSILVLGRDTLISRAGGAGLYDFNLFVAKLDSADNVEVGINIINPSSKITIYPNPSNGNFYFSGVQSGASIEVHNMLGEMVYSGQTNADIYPVSLSGQAKGMYFYKVSNNAGTIQQGKMILE